MNVGLKCPVRGCTEPLAREGSRWTCARNHAFDQRRSGALNLLQPQDRRSRTPGDSRETALARRRLAGLRYMDSTHRILRRAVEAAQSGAPAMLLDVGCGEGAFLRTLDGVPDLELRGVDISAPSIELAARASPPILFIVANADRFLPCEDGSFDFIISINARVNAGEFTRVLKPRGRIMVAVPGPDDLIELREHVQGRRVEKSRSARILAELAADFVLHERATVHETRIFEPSALRDLLTATYRGFRASEQAAVNALDRMNVTLSHEVLTFVRRGQE
jgi:23S rRNA (guanine745-N1)-methyltransferase